MSRDGFYVDEVCLKKKSRVFLKDMSDIFQTYVFISFAKTDVRYVRVVEDWQKKIDEVPTNKSFP